VEKINRKPTTNMMNITQSAITSSLISSQQICNVPIVYAESEVIVYLSASVLSNAKYNLKDAAAKETVTVGITGAFVSNRIKFAPQLHASTAAVQRTPRIIGAKIIKSILAATN
jgi:hypothetical protein